MFEIDPSVFGPGTWIVTHTLALVSDRGERKRDTRFYKLYVYRMIHALPCAQCRRHAAQYLKRTPVPKWGSGDSMFAWSVDFHNTVNARLGKPIISLETALEMYEDTELLLKNKVTGASCRIDTGVATVEKQHGCVNEPL